MRKFWTKAEDRMLRKHYPHMRTDAVAAEIYRQGFCVIRLNANYTKTQGEEK